MKRIGIGALAASVAALVVNAAEASCGSAFCFVNTNWSLQGVWTQPGPHFDLRYEYIDQDQPRAGSDKVSVGEIPRHHDEVSTLNKNTIATLDYGFSPEWGATIVVPIVSRDHEHIHNHQGEQLLEQWNFTDLGDVRVQGRWQTLIGETTAQRAGFAGLTFGLTLPTGKFHVTNSEGELAERSLQPGTGTTQLALSAYFREALPMLNSQWYAQVATLLPLNSRENYKPGNQFGADLGYRDLMYPTRWVSTSSSTTSTKVGAKVRKPSRRIAAGIPSRLHRESRMPSRRLFRCMGSCSCRSIST